MRLVVRSHENHMQVDHHPKALSLDILLYLLGLWCTAFVLIDFDRHRCSLDDLVIECTCLASLGIYLVFFW